MRNESELTEAVVVTVRTRQREKRQQLMSNLVYLLIGALLALAGVQLPSCADLHVVCPECDTVSYETETETGTETIERNRSATRELQNDDTDTGSNEDVTDEPLKTDMETDAGTDADTDTGTANPLNDVIDNCAAMRDFFGECYWSEESWSGPTYTQMNQECSVGTVSEYLNSWYACYVLPQNSCNCPNGSGSDIFVCQPDKCKQWMSCMTECRL